jgi:glucose/arabinose dehydrogenase
MKFKVLGMNAAVATMVIAMASCSTQEQAAPKPAAPPAPSPSAGAETKAPPEKAEVKAKATKLAGDVGLLDTEKNYLIIVSKEGKLVTIDFDPKFQPTERTPHPAKVADVGLGSSATVQYTKQGDKNVAQDIEFVPAKGE